MLLDLDFLKLAVPSLIALVTLAFALPQSLKAWEERRHIQRVHRRAESEFALQLSVAYDDPNIKRYGEELGYAALIGDRRLSHTQRKLLLSFPDAQQLIETYMRTSGLVAISCEKQGFIWKEHRYEYKIYRYYLKLSWFLAYLITVPLAFSPWLMWSLTHSSRPTLGLMLWYQFITIIFLLPLAFYSLRLASQITAAEQFMEEQGSSTYLPLKQP